VAATGDDSLYGSRYFEALEDWHRLSQPEFGAFLRAAVKPGRARALDLGCGSGAWGAQLAELASHVDGCDLAAAGLERARRTGHYEKLFTADLSQTANPLPEERYDLVFTTEVIEHVPDHRLFCEHVAQALVPGGQLVLTTTTYHLYLLYYWLYHEDRRLRDYVDFALGCVFPRPADRFVRRLWMLTGGHEHGFRRRRLLRAMRAAGFTIERCRYAHPQPVCPVEGLDQPNFARRRVAILRRPLRAAGRGLDRFCRATGWYGPNILVAAVKAGPADPATTPKPPAEPAR
jgi:2-polyprenyl-3-methyl-5-hydroxy-6-metoxy-1,4-benzoquinol methylase